jgi:thiosulfate dehydrogenase
MAYLRSTISAVVSTAVVTVVVIVVVGLLAVAMGVMPANADANPGRLEKWAAGTSLHAAIDRDIKALRAPPGVATDSTMTLGVKLYGGNCAVCHGAFDAKPSSVAQGLYQKPPQFGKHGVSDDPIEETYWKITHGIRLTGMPAYVETLSERERWAIASFLRYQDSLPPAAAAAWKALPSVAADHQPAAAP